MKGRIHISCGRFLVGVAMLTGSRAVAGEPLKLHPENPHYLLFLGKPTVLITSGEHYGAVLNLDFDYVAYFEELREKGLNHTRTFSGVYREVLGSFGITDNTLAPKPNRYICPWARSDTPGYFDGGNKFDLTKWDEDYFRRLKDFMTEASKRGIVVEMNLFCPMYADEMWQACPMNAPNNINGIGNCPRTEVYTLKHKDLLAVHEAVTRKIVEQLKDFDNLYYEVCNEAYFGGVTMEWQDFIIATIVDAEKSSPSKHLISLNIANGRAKVENPNPAVSIFNFHYCVPPDTVAMNYHLNKVIGENETGFRGNKDVTYRTEGWDFIIAGGALYNNLDYSFTPQHPRGTFLDYKSPGGGSPALRKQLRILKDFIEGFDFIRMAPDNGVIKSGVPAGMQARALAEKGKAYAIYIHRPSGRSDYSVRWTGQVIPKYSETYTFHTVSNDGVRLWVDGKLVIDNWTDHSVTEDEGKIQLDAGRKVNIKIEFYQGGGGAVAKLSWSSPSQKKEIVPEDCFLLPDGTGKGLKGEYFEGKDLGKLVMTRTDATVNFDWSQRSPFDVESTQPGVALVLDLPAGRYRAEWVNTLTGKVDKSEVFEHSGGNNTIISPFFPEDIALQVKRTGK
ncbi:MAG: PA14 domain-containing protein [bacterium]|nr:PA14 domain-containing protein [bacterium]